MAAGRQGERGGSASARARAAAAGARRPSLSARAGRPPRQPAYGGAHAPPPFPLSPAISRAPSADGKGDAFVFFVGPRGSGKTTLLNRFLYPGRARPPRLAAPCILACRHRCPPASLRPRSLLRLHRHPLTLNRRLPSPLPIQTPQSDLPKPSEGLEYTYARKPSAFDHERRELAHFWELAAAGDVAERIAQVDGVFLSYKQARPRERGERAGLGWGGWEGGRSAGRLAACVGAAGPSPAAAPPPPLSLPPPPLPPT